MQQKVPLFFAPNTSNIKKQEDSPLEHAQKTIEALIAYNKSLALRLIKANPKEIIEFMLSIYLNFDDMPPVNNSVLAVLDTQAFKKLAIDHIINDIALYEKIQLQVNKGDMDNIYLSILYAKKASISTLWDDITPDGAFKFLCKFFPEKDAEYKAKQIIKYMKTLSNKLPLLVEYNILNDLLKILSPQISPVCVKFLDNFEMDFDGKIACLAMSHYETNRLERTRVKYLSESSPSPELKKLILQYHFLVSDRTTKIAQDIFHGYIDLCNKMKTVYQLENKIDYLIRMETAQKPGNDISKPDVQNPSSVKKNKAPLSKITIKKKKPKQLKSPKENLETPELFTNPANELPKIETINELPSCIVIEPAISEPVKEPEGTAEILPIELNEGEQPEEEQIYIYQPYYKQAKTVIHQTQSNTLNLKDEDKKTFLKVFGLMSYDTISIRALVNLTSYFGGSIETTGGNRCRMKIKNIYAFIAVPAEALENTCNSATVTMHGGGHRATRSQNHDRGNAPDYLVAQFKDAFTRAGFTPVNLGLSMDPVITTSSISQKL